MTCFLASCTAASILSSFDGLHSKTIFSDSDDCGSSIFINNESSYDNSGDYFSYSNNSSPTESSDELIDDATINLHNRVLIGSASTELIASYSNYLTQGLCSFENGYFVTLCPVTQKDYYVSKFFYQQKESFLNPSITYNHANGMAYNYLDKNLYICKLSSDSSTSGCDRDCDFSFYVVDSITFEILDEIDLYDIIKQVCPDSIGISGIAYNQKTQKIYVLTRKPKRFIIILNDDFSYNNSFFICDDSDDFLFGDISSFDDYIVTCYWNTKESDLSNIISFYDLSGNLVMDYEIYGITHIESIDKYNDRLLANFNDFSEGISTKIYAIDIL